MNAGGVDVEILSNPSMYIRVDEHSPELCRLVNDRYADACRQNPERFKAFANLPFNHMRDALAELDRVLALPGFDCARALVGIDHLGYGSDYFMQGSQFMHWTNAFLDSLDLSKSDKEKIYSGNPLRFLGM